MTAFQRPPITFSARSAGNSGSRFIGSPIVTSRSVMNELVCSLDRHRTTISLAVETPTPIPDRGQVLVKVRAAGVNFSDTLMRQNRYALTPELPAIPGTEVAGTIERLGDGVDGPMVGARV